jgi:predicted AAA+ superfamily ATPase
MELIQREHYLDRLLRFASGPSVVAVVGLRRVGKSVLLRQLVERLRRDADVIYVDMEDLDFGDLETATDLNTYVKSKRRTGRRTYVVIDEVQEIAEWQRAVASLHGRDDTHLVIAGSNAALFSGALATKLAGRYTTLRVLPLSLAEFEELHGLTNSAATSTLESFERFRRIGGLPGILHTDLSPDLVQQMQRDIYSTIALRDIVERHAIRDVATLEAVSRFAMDNVGNLVTAKRISDYMRTHRGSGSPDTVVNYLSYLCDAFVVERVDRYDVIGKRHLQIGSKYYLGDLGLRAGQLGTHDRWIGSDLENLVFHELLRRGYRVSVGTVGDREVDFIAEQPAGIIYVQVCYRIDSESVRDREVASLLDIRSADPKVIVSMDEVEPGGLSGIRHVNAIEFLRGAPLVPPHPH